jgi:hypothetical protein
MHCIVARAISTASLGQMAGEYHGVMTKNRLFEAFRLCFCKVACGEA